MPGRLALLNKKAYTYPLQKLGYRVKLGAERRPGRRLRCICKASSKVQVVFVATEVAPWAKTGGLGDVVDALPAALASRGHRVMTVSPKYANYQGVYDTGLLAPVEVPVTGGSAVAQDGEGLSSGPGMPDSQAEQAAGQQAHDSSQAQHATGGGTTGGGTTQSYLEAAGYGDAGAQAPTHKAGSGKVLNGAQQQNQTDVSFVRYYACVDKGVLRVFVDHPLFSAAAGTGGGDQMAVVDTAAGPIFTYGEGLDNIDLQARNSILCQAALAAPVLLWEDPAQLPADMRPGVSAHMTPISLHNGLARPCGADHRAPNFSTSAHGSCGQQALQGPVVFVGNDWPIALLPVWLKVYQDMLQTAKAANALLARAVGSSVLLPELGLSDGNLNGQFSESESSAGAGPSPVDLQAMLDDAKQKARSLAKTALAVGQAAAAVAALQVKPAASRLVRDAQQGQAGPGPRRVRATRPTAKHRQQGQQPARSGADAGAGQKPSSNVTVSRYAEVRHQASSIGQGSNGDAGSSDTNGVRTWWQAPGSPQPAASHQDQQQGHHPPDATLQQLPQPSTDDAWDGERGAQQQQEALGPMPSTSSDASHYGPYVDAGPGPQSESNGNGYQPPQATSQPASSSGWPSASGGTWDPGLQPQSEQPKQAPSQPVLVPVYAPQEQQQAQPPLERAASQSQQSQQQPSSEAPAMPTTEQRLAPSHHPDAAATTPASTPLQGKRGYGTVPQSASDGAEVDNSSSAMHQASTGLPSSRGPSRDLVPGLSATSVADADADALGVAEAVAMDADLETTAPASASDSAADAAATRAANMDARAIDLLVQYEQRRQDQLLLQLFYAVQQLVPGVAEAIDSAGLDTSASAATAALPGQRPRGSGSEADVQGRLRRSLDSFRRQVAQRLQGARVVFTLHNFAFQGLFSAASFERLGLPLQQLQQMLLGQQQPERPALPAPVAETDSDAAADGYADAATAADGDADAAAPEKISWLKAALLVSDELVTVSPTYAAELTADSGSGSNTAQPEPSAALAQDADGSATPQQRHRARMQRPVPLQGLPQQGADELRAILRSRGLKAITNGLDVIAWDPATDALLPSALRYGPADAAAGKARAKAVLQARLGLQVSRDVPLVGFVGRLEEQKGADVMLAALSMLLGPAAAGTVNPALQRKLAELAAATQAPAPAQAEAQQDQDQDQDLQQQQLPGAAKQLLELAQEMQVQEVREQQAAAAAAGGSVSAGAGSGSGNATGAAAGGLQVAMLGQGQQWLEQGLAAMQHAYRGRAAGIAGFDESLAHLMMAACDYLVVPSRFEPCGLVALAAQRYGTVPIVAPTGGLLDIVQAVPQPQPQPQPAQAPLQSPSLADGGTAGTGGWQLEARLGYVLSRAIAPADDPISMRASEQALAAAVRHAVSQYGSDAYVQLRARCMAQDVSWDAAAAQWEQMLLGLTAGGSAAAAAGAPDAPMAGYETEPSDS